MTTAVLSLNGAPLATLAGGAITAADGDSSSSVTVSEATQRMMTLLGSVARVQLSDGRLVTGRFYCFDKHQNVILTEAREYAPPARAVSTEKTSGKKKKDAHVAAMSEEDETRVLQTATSRALGMTLVPGKHIVAIKVQSSK